MDVKLLAQQYYNTTKKAVKTVVNKYKKNKNEKEDEKLLDAILLDFPLDTHILVKSILQRQLEYIRTTTTPNISDSYNKLMLTGITPLIIKKLLVLRGIVGIQPMKGPVGLVYTLCYNYSSVPKEKSSQSEDVPFNKIIPTSLKVVSNTVEAYSRKLQVCWHLEAQQDFKHYPGLNFETEMVSILSSEVISEIVSEILQDLVTIASQNEITIVNSNLELDSEILYTNINKQSVDIARHTKRGRGNFIVTSPEGLSLLLQHPNICFRFNTIHDKSDFSFLHVGDIITKSDNSAEESKVLYRVYTSSTPPITQNSEVYRFLIGYKGGVSEIDTGYIHCPYVPIMTSPLYVDEYTFQPRKHLLARFGKWFRTETAPNNTTFLLSQNYYRIVDFKLNDSLSECDEESSVVID